MLKKITFIITLFLTFFMFSILTGCHQNTKVNQSNIREIEFWTLQLDSFTPFLKGVISQYEAKHPDIKIKWVDVPFSEGEKRSLASIMSKKTPDLINLNPDFASTLSSRGALINLNEYLTKEQYNEYIPESWESNTVNGNIFGIPWYITTSVTFYNNEILKSAGINPNSEPQKFDDLPLFAKSIKDKTSKYAFMPALCEGGYILKMFNLNQGLKYENNTLKINTPENVKLLKMLKSIYTNKLIPEESITQGHRDSLEKFMSGETAFIVTGANFAKIIKENSPKIYKNLSVKEQITGNSGEYDFSIMNLIIPQKAEFPKEALDFALFLTNANNQLEFSKLAPVLPSTKKSLNSEYFSSNITDTISRSLSISANQLKNPASPIPPFQNKSEINEIANAMVQYVLLNQKTPEKAIVDAERDINKILSEN